MNVEEAAAEAIVHATTKLDRVAFADGPQIKAICEGIAAIVAATHFPTRQEGDVDGLAAWVTRAQASEDRLAKAKSALESIRDHAAESGPEARIFATQALLELEG